MALISIVGTSGAGKSFLVKQLASLNHMPAFFEGEEGTIPQEVFETVFTGTPMDRFAYFLDRYAKNLINGRIASDSGLDSYVDGAEIAFEAIKLYEAEQYHDQLQEIINRFKGNESDLLVVLTATEEKLRELVVMRGRTSEEVEQTIERSIKIQNNYLKLVSEYSNILVIDRTNLDFSDSKTLKDVDQKIKEAI